MVVSVLVRRYQSKYRGFKFNKALSKVEGERSGATAKRAGEGSNNKQIKTIELSIYQAAIWLAK